MLAALARVWVLCRFVLYAHMTPLLLKAKSKDLHVTDVDRSHVSSAALGDRMHATLSALPSDLRLSRPLYAFALAAWHVTGRRYLLCGALRLFNDVSVILGPFCLRGLITAMAPEYSSPTPAIPPSACWYAGGIFASMMLQSIFQQHHYYQTVICGARVKAAMMYCVMRACNAATAADIKRLGQGGFVSLMNTHTFRISELMCRT